MVVSELVYTGSVGPSRSQRQLSIGLLCTFLLAVLPVEESVLITVTF